MKKIPYSSRFKLSGRTSLDNEDEEFRSRIFMHIENRRTRMRRQRIRTNWYKKQALPTEAPPTDNIFINLTSPCYEVKGSTNTNSLRGCSSAPPTFSGTPCQETRVEYELHGCASTPVYSTEPLDFLPNTTAPIRQYSAEDNFQEFLQPLYDIADLEELQFLKHEDCTESIDDQKTLPVRQMENTPIDEKNVIRMFLQEDPLGQAYSCALPASCERSKQPVEDTRSEQIWISKSIARWEECYQVVSAQVHRWFPFPHFAKYTSAQIEKLILSSCDTSEYLARHKNMKRLFVFYSIIGLGSFLIGDREEAENYFAEAIKCQEEMMSSKHLLIGLFLRCVYYLYIGDRKRSADDSNRILCMLDQWKKREDQQACHLYDACLLICFLLWMGYDEVSTRKILKTALNSKTLNYTFCQNFEETACNLSDESDPSNVQESNNLSIQEMMKIFVHQELSKLTTEKQVTNARAILISTLIGHIIHNLNGSFSELLEIFPILSKIESHIVHQIRDQRVQDTLQMMVMGLRAHLFFFFKMEEECMREANHALDIATFLLGRNEETFWLTVALEVIFRVLVGAFNLLGMQRSVRVVWEVQQRLPFVFPQFERYFSFYRNTFG